MRKELPKQYIKCQSGCFNRERVEGMQNENLLDVLEMVVRTSLMRKESRGAMYRVDFPQTDDDNWLVNIIVSRGECEWRMNKEAVRGEYVSLPEGQRNYGKKEIG